MNTFQVETFLSNVNNDSNLTTHAVFLGLLYLYEDDNFDIFALYRESDVNFMMFLLDNRDNRNSYTDIYGPTLSQIFEWCTLREKYEHG